MSCCLGIFIGFAGFCGLCFFGLFQVVISANGAGLVSITSVVVRLRLVRLRVSVQVLGFWLIVLGLPSIRKYSPFFHYVLQFLPAANIFAPSWPQVRSSIN